MREHTPGPWECRKGYLRSLSDGTTIAELVDTEEQGLTREEAFRRDIADCNLIAAAPDLYKALDYIVGWMNGAAGDRNLLLDDAYNALAKAEGEINA